MIEETRFENAISMTRSFSTTKFSVYNYIIYCKSWW